MCGCPFANLAHLQGEQRVNLENLIFAFLNTTVACEIKLVENYFSLHRRPTEIILFQRMETCLKLFSNYRTSEAYCSS